MLTSEKYDIRPDIFTADGAGYVHGEPVAYDATNNVWKKCVLNTDSADGVVYDAVDIDDTKGLVVMSGGVRASAIVGYSALATDALKGQVRLQLLDKNIIVEDV